MAASTNETSLDGRLVSFVGHFLDGLHTSDIDSVLHKWRAIDKDFLDSHNSGSMNLDTSSLAVGISDCMSLLCDAFMDLQVKTDGRALELERHLDSLDAASSSRSPSPYTQCSPFSSTYTLPPHITPCHTWLLANLHNPYPSLPTRDSIASSTNTDRRIIDSWFVDVRRRIGWTALVESGRERDANTKRRKTSLMLGGMGATQGRRSGLKYRSRNELISAASQFFLPSSSSSSSSSAAHHSNLTNLTPLEIQTFSALQNAAHALYKDKGLSTTMKKEGSPEISQSPKSNNKKRRGFSSSFEATTATSIKQEESSSDAEEDDDSYVTTPTDGSFPFYNPYANSSSSSFSSTSTSTSVSSTSTSSSVSSTSASSPTPSSSSTSQTPSLKRKRAVSSFEEYPSTPTATSFSTSPVSPATKRLRTALNGAGVLRSVSDPTPVPLFTSTPASASGSGLGSSGFTQPLTFDGFSASALDAWFSGIGTGTGTGTGSGSVESGKEVSEEWIDPFFFGLPDPVVRQTEAEGENALNTSTSTSTNTNTNTNGNSTIPHPILPYPLDINVNVNIGDLASYAYSSSSSYGSPSSSSPSTPALSASGTLTDDTDTDNDTDNEGDDDRDSLFGDNDHDRDRDDILNNFHATATANAKPNTNTRDFSTDFPPSFPLNVNIDLTSFPELAQFPDF
ncbi:hypothetical protein EV360DRAFT_54014, partial [Lentinula raphanica]